MSTEVVITDLSKGKSSERDRAVAAIRAGLSQYNLSRYPNATSDDLVLVLERDNVVVGGLTGRLAWGWLRVDFLWIEDSLRGQDHGGQLLRRAEELALASSCHAAHTDTFSFQALDFYLGAGYEVFGQLNDHPPGETHYYLKKILSEEDEGPHGR
ncbi:MAG: GNAT family N-acetyltransferase [Gammaproteobacteria bacterium]|nr:GNAT family N-acetyltransferase [Gammaproteobacteria bacterium]